MIRLTGIGCTRVRVGPFPAALHCSRLLLLCRFGLEVIVVVAVQVAGELPGFVVRKAAVFREYDFDVQAVLVRLCQPGEDLVELAARYG